MKRESIYRAALDRISAMAVPGASHIAREAIVAADALPADAPASTDFGAKSVFRRAYLDWAEWGRESRQLSLGALDAAFEALDSYRRGGKP